MTELSIPDPPRAAGRRERRKRQVRDQITAAARDLFERQGIAATTIGQIAAAADVAEKTFYNHFGTRAELLAELASEHREALLARVERARRSPATTRARIGELCRDLAGRRAEASPVALQLAAAAPADADDELERALLDLLEDGLARGDVAPALDTHFAAELAAAGIAAALRNHAVRPDYPLRLRLEQIADLIGAAIEPR